MRSSGFEPKAGSSWLSSTQRTPLFVDGLQRSKRASLHSPATKSRNKGTARPGTAPAVSGSVMQAWHSRRASAMPMVVTGPSEMRLERPAALCSRT